MRNIVLFIICSLDARLFFFNFFIAFVLVDSIRKIHKIWRSWSNVQNTQTQSNNKNKFVRICLRHSIQSIVGYSIINWVRRISNRFLNNTEYTHILLFLYIFESIDWRKNNKRKTFHNGWNCVLSVTINSTQT